jgi:hypothetical protein
MSALGKRLQQAMDYPWCRVNIRLTRWGFKGKDLSYEPGTEVTFSPRTPLPKLWEPSSQSEGQPRHTVRNKTKA